MFRLTAALRERLAVLLLGTSRVALLADARAVAALEVEVERAVGAQFICEKSTCGWIVSSIEWS